MPTGAPGDDPILDITRYGLPVVTPAIDLLIAEIVALGGRDQVSVGQLSEIQWGSAIPPDLEANLRSLRERLVSNATESGWEVDRLLNDARHQLGRSQPPSSRPES